MSNPNPSPATRFGPKNPGRPKEARDRISRAFLTAVAEDFEAHGKAAIIRVREEDPSTYVRVVASLQPKELEITRPLDNLTDDELSKIIDAVTDELRAKAEAPIQKELHVSRH